MKTYGMSLEEVMEHIKGKTTEEKSRVLWNALDHNKLLRNDTEAHVLLALKMVYTQRSDEELKKDYDVPAHLQKRLDAHNKERAYYQCQSDYYQNEYRLQGRAIMGEIGAARYEKAELASYQQQQEFAKHLYARGYAKLGDATMQEIHASLPDAEYSTRYDLSTTLPAIQASKDNGCKFMLPTFVEIRDQERHNRGILPAKKGWTPRQTVVYDPW